MRRLLFLQKPAAPWAGNVISFWSKAGATADTLYCKG